MVKTSGCDPVNRGSTPRPPLEKFYAYLVTDVTGNQIGKTKPGQHMLEREYKGNGEYTWCIYNFGEEDFPLVATITGTYVGIVYGQGGKLTEESKALLHP